MLNTIGNILLLVGIFFFCAGNASGMFFCTCFMGLVYTHQIVDAIKKSKK